MAGDESRRTVPLRETFDTVAERYDRIRPSYQPRIFDDLARLAGLRRGSAVLEIGCGTGQATLPLAQRGYSIVAIELGARLAEIARRNLAGYPDVAVVVSAFEDWEVPPSEFDAVVSATAFHWIDPAVRVTKAAAALRPGGTLAVIEARRLPMASEPILARMRACYERWTAEPAPAFEPPGRDVSATAAEIEATGLFDRVEVRPYSSTHRYSTAHHRELLLTFSSTLVLDAERRAGLVACIDDVVDAELGGTLTERALIRLVTARKR